MEPTSRCGHVVVTVPHQRGLYMLGGEVWAQGEGSRAAASTNEIWRLTIDVVEESGSSESFAWEKPQVEANACFTPRFGHAMMVAKNGVGYLFGGRNETTMFADTWRVDFSLVPLHFRRLLVGKGQHPPARRYGHSFTYLPSHDMGMVLGGVSDRGEMKDAFLFDVRHEVWRELKIASLPTGLAYHSAVASPGGDGVLLFGGRKKSGELSQELVSFSVVLEDDANVPEAASQDPTPDQTPSAEPSQTSTPVSPPISHQAHLKPKMYRKVKSADAQLVYAQNPDSAPAGRLLLSLNLLADGDTLMVAGGQRVRTHRMLPPICSDIVIFSISRRLWCSVPTIPFPQRYHHVAVSLSPSLLGGPSHSPEAVPSAAEFQSMSPSRQRALDLQTLADEACQEGVIFIGGLPFSSQRPFTFRVSRTMLEDAIDSLGGNAGASLLNTATECPMQNAVVNTAIPDPPQLLGNCFSVAVMRHPTVGHFEHRDPLGYRQDLKILGKGASLTSPSSISGRPDSLIEECSVSALNSPGMSGLSPESPHCPSFAGSPRSDKTSVVILGAHGTEELGIERGYARKFLLPWLRRIRRNLRAKRQLGLQRTSASRSSPLSGAMTGAPMEPVVEGTVTNSRGEEVPKCLSCSQMPLTHYAKPCDHLSLCSHCRNTAMRCPVCQGYVKGSALAMSAELPVVLNFLADKEADLVRREARWMKRPPKKVNFDRSIIGGLLPVASSPKDRAQCEIGPNEDKVHERKRFELPKRRVTGQFGRGTVSSTGIAKNQRTVSSSILLREDSSTKTDEMKQSDVLAGTLRPKHRSEQLLATRSPIPTIRPCSAPLSENPGVQPGTRTPFSLRATQNAVRGIVRKKRPDGRYVKASQEPDFPWYHESRNDPLSVRRSLKCKIGML